MESILNYRAWLLVVIVSLSLISGALRADNEHTHITKKIIDIGELPTGRPAKITLWFPEGNCAGLSHQQHCLADSAITDRTIVFSHGAMGAAENYHWLAEPLAAAGYVVVGINHYGESWFYGTETQDFQATSMLWQRPEDISAIYDALSNRELFQQKVNWSNIIALGHSSGAQTIAMLAGARYNLLQMMDFCKTDASKNDHSCDYGIRNTPQPGESFLQKFGGVYADPRVKKLIMIDPTLGYGVTPESLAKVKLPTFIVGAKNNDFLPWENHGARYLKSIPNAKAHELTGQEGHFIFIDSCNNEVMVMGVSLCRDRVGVDRITTQKNLVPIVLDFVREENIVIDAAKRFTEQKKPAFNLGKISQILMYTPHWVFGLLAGLIILGLIQVRTRQVPVNVAFIMPVGMMLMSVIGTLMDLGFNLITIFCWLSGAALITSIKLSTKAIAGYDHTTRRLLLQGSWIPFVVIMAIFCARYALGMSKGMNLPIVHEFYFAPVMSFLLGSLSGYFIAQGIQYLKIVNIAKRNNF